MLKTESLTNFHSVVDILLHLVHVFLRALSDLVSSRPSVRSLRLVLFDVTSVRFLRILLPSTSVGDLLGVVNELWRRLPVSLLLVTGQLHLGLIHDSGCSLYLVAVLGIVFPRSHHYRGAGVTEELRFLILDLTALIAVITARPT